MRITWQKFNNAVAWLTTRPHRQAPFVTWEPKLYWLSTFLVHEMLGTWPCVGTFHHTSVALHMSLLAWRSSWMWPCCRFFLNLQQEDEAQQFTVRVCREKICAEEEKKKTLASTSGTPQTNQCCSLSWAPLLTGTAGLRWTTYMHFDIWYLNLIGDEIWLVAHPYVFC